MNTNTLYVSSNINRIMDYDDSITDLIIYYPLGDKMPDGLLSHSLPNKISRSYDGFLNNFGWLLEYIAQVAGAKTDIEFNVSGFLFSHGFFITLPEGQVDLAGFWIRIMDFIFINNMDVDKFFKSKTLSKKFESEFLYYFSGLYEIFQYLLDAIRENDSFAKSYKSSRDERKDRVLINIMFIFNIEGLHNVRTSHLIAYEVFLKLYKLFDEKSFVYKYTGHMKDQIQDDLFGNFVNRIDPCVFYASGLNYISVNNVMRESENRGIMVKPMGEKEEMARTLKRMRG